jgi:hypothetical protein
MKGLITSAVVVVTLSTLITGQVRGQVISGASKKDTPVTRMTEGTAKSNRDWMLQDALPSLWIQQFTARRVGTGINVTAVVSNRSDRLVPFSYKISKWTGTGWTTVQASGTRFIQPRATADVKEDLPATNGALKLRLAVTGGTEREVTREVTLPAKKAVFVVRYGTHTSADWWLAREWKDDLSDGFDAQQPARELGSFGFQTQIKKKKTTGIGTWFSGGVSIRTSLFVRLPDPIRQTFATRQEAQKFRDSLRAVTKFPGVFVEDIREE